jgi:serine/threonine-protein kinase
VIGETIKDFKITARLGKGGMGEVYVAEQQIVKTKVAIKLLLPEISRDTAHVERFFNEAIAVSRIQHAGIVKIFDVGFTSDGRAFLIMEFLTGTTLSARIAATGRLPLTTVAELGRQIASILAATHAAGIVHRDLKPDNIFLVPDAELASRERVKILDFGIAKLGATSGVTATGSSMGTPGYMAPEMWTNASKADARADIYAFGCVAFEMCCGATPFVSGSIGEACNKHLSEMPPRISSRVPAIPVAVDEVIDRMLAKRADDRPALAEVERTFVDTAASARNDVDTTAPPETRPVPKPPPATTKPPIGTPPPREPAKQVLARSRVVAMLAGGVVLASVVTALVLTLSRSHDLATADARVRDSKTVVVSDAAARDAPPLAPGMVRIVGGGFDMGSTPDEIRALETWCASFAPSYCKERKSMFETQEPLRHIDVATFDLDVHEVGRAELVEWLTVQHASARENDAIADSGVVLAAIGPGTGIRWDAKQARFVVDGDPTLPAIGLTWEGARRLCAARSARLPSDAEWEFAARGSVRRRFPWGDTDPDCRAAVFGDRRVEQWKGCSNGGPKSVVRSEIGRDVTEDGVRDLAGNVSEWVDGSSGVRERECDAGELRIARGGSYIALPEQLRGARRLYVCPTERAPDLGVRCAR